MDIFIIISMLFYKLVLTPGKATPISSQGNSLQHFAKFTDNMYISSNHTIGSPCRLPLDACAERCLNYSNYEHRTFENPILNPGIPNEVSSNQQQGVEYLRPDRGTLCLAFEYIISTRYCILLKKAAGENIQGYHDLKKAPGTTYFELSKSTQDLYTKRNHVVLDGQEMYNKVISNVSVDQCADECVNALDLTCNSFVFSASMHVCALSSRFANKDVSLKTTSLYDFFQYSGGWPCNVTLLWQYRPRIIASQGYPYVYHGNTSCHSKIIAPPGMKIALHVKAFFTNIAMNSGRDGLFIFEGEERSENIIESFCQKSDNMRHTTITSSNRIINVNIVQQRNIIITRITYDFLPMNCASSPCLSNGHCLETAGSFQCICPYGTSGKRCDIYIGHCYRKPCINGTCHPVDDTSGYQCTCSAGFTGENCEYNINECLSSPCVNGICEDIINDYRCVCNDSNTGRHCEINKNLATCSRHNCHFGACAVNESGSYCQCFPGFTGISCDSDIDDCYNSPCSHGKCIDHVNSYSCSCSLGYAGENCDIFVSDPCRDKPCYHGYCSVNKDGYSCLCESGFTGSKCEYKTNACFHKCRNGKCFNVNNSSYDQCICYRGFTGENCEFTKDNCKDLSCTVSYTDSYNFMNQNNTTATTKTSKPTESNLTFLRYSNTWSPMSPSSKVTHNQRPTLIPVSVSTKHHRSHIDHNNPDETVSAVSRQPTTDIKHITQITNSNGRSVSGSDVSALYATMTSALKAGPSGESTATRGIVQVKGETNISLINHSCHHVTNKENIQTMIRTDVQLEPGITYFTSYPKTDTQTWEYGNTFFTQSRSVVPKQIFNFLNRSKNTHEMASTLTVSPMRLNLKTYLPNSEHRVQTTVSKFTEPPSNRWLKTASQSLAISTNYWLYRSSLPLPLPLKSTRTSKIPTSMKNILSTVNPHYVTLKSPFYERTSTLKLGKLDSLTSDAPKQFPAYQKPSYIATSTLPSIMSTIGKATYIPYTKQTFSFKQDNMTSMIANDTTSSLIHIVSKYTDKPSFENRETSTQDLLTSITQIQKPSNPDFTHSKTLLNNKHTSTDMDMLRHVTNVSSEQSNYSLGTSPSLLEYFTNTFTKLDNTKSVISRNQQNHLSNAAPTKQRDKYKHSNFKIENGSTTDNSFTQDENTSVLDTKAEAVNDVITAESVIIGALFVAVILTVSVAIFVLYQRHRSGTLYISSPLHSLGRSITSMNDLFSDSSNDCDVETRQEVKPRTCSVSGKLYETPHNDVSPSGKYDDVESPDLSFPTTVRRLVPRNRALFKDGSVVNIARGDGVISPVDVSEGVRGNIKVRLPVIKPHEDRRLTATNPIYGKQDGTVELRLSSNHKNLENCDPSEALKVAHRKNLRHNWNRF